MATKIIKLANKWERFVVIKRKRITLPRLDESSSTTEKGHFVVYTTDSRRFVLPLGYLNSGIIKEMLELAEEEFGLPANGPLTVPLDSSFLEYIISLIRRNVADDLQKVLITSFASGRCLSSSCLHQEQANQQIIRGF
ncbi:hypothetical protein UlMin_032176 [Ulmus minor]